MSHQFTPLPFSKVTIDGGFWGPRLDTNREVTIPIEYRQCKDTGRIDAFKLDWKPGRLPVPHIFWDSDVAKWIEAASYSLAGHPDPQLEAHLDEVISLIAASQQPDGYLNSHFSAVEPEKRWTNLRDWHELYCAGHLTEAGVAHFQATGKRTLLDVVCRYADHIGRVFGTGPGQKRGYPGHPELELALVKLYHVTGERRYLDLSQYFVDERGRQPHYYDQEARARGDDPAAFWAKTYAYMQAHLPVREQRQVTGHAVRAMYLYSAMADLAGETGDQGLRAAGEVLWDHLCTRNLYLTGGIGPSRNNEGFTRDYDLPNETAYAETCAAIGLVFWNHRLLQLEGDARYADTLERALYNGVLSGVSLSGDLFFYENPLASLGAHHRQPWFDCACCPPNLARLLASLGGYVYSYNDAGVAVHLYVQGVGQFSLPGGSLTLHQATNYPWDGGVAFSLEMDHPMKFELSLRFPGWCRNASLSVNGQEQPLALYPFTPSGTPKGEPSRSRQGDGGYIRLEREWRPGDQVRFEMDMPVERVYAHPEVLQDVGKVALQRGPLVYCVEQVDQEVPVNRLVLPKESQLLASFEPGLLGGVVKLTGQALVSEDQDWGKQLYRPQQAGLKAGMLTAIPYYAWDNRQPGGMAVWLPEV
jgi:DUF1680 family protein